MPKENKKRGRRMEEKKRKHGETEEDPSLVAESSKRRKSSDQVEQQQDFVKLEDGQDGVDAAYPPLQDKPFFGMLDEEEQEYFKHADEMLELNQFDDAESRKLFLENVWREADGKELKIANSQSCSRLMERLIQLSTPEQLKGLFQKFSGNFVHLMTHRFASHCCEALFLNAAPVVTDELLAKPKKGEQAGASLVDGDEIWRGTMEDRFLELLSELEGNVGFLLTDRFASHVFRVLLVVVSGEPLDSAANKQLLQSKKKEQITVEGTEKLVKEQVKQSRTMPKSFSAALEKLITESIAGLDTEKLRALATHPNGNPTLQLLLRLELSHFGKQRAKDEHSIIRTLLPDEPVTADSQSAAFVNAMVYDPIGSRLIETLVECAPAKLFKNMYGTLFKERLASFARNEVAGFVACRVLERLGKDDLLEAHELIAPNISSLLERGRTNVVRTLIERCSIRDIDTKAIAVCIDSTWHGPDGFEVKKLLKVDMSSDEKDGTPHDSVQSSSELPNPSSAAARAPDPVKVHFNVLAQAMLLVPGALSGLVLDSLVTLESEILLNMCKDPVVSRTLQAAIVSKTSTIITTRKLVQHFYGHIGDLALDKAASHVVDCIWEGTHGLAFIRERIAEELAENEAQLRESPCGRAVWKNWKMDIYKRRRAEWIRQSKIKASNDGFQSFSELDVKHKDGKQKTPLELARERHARNKNTTTAGKEKEKESGRSGRKGSGGRPPSSGGGASASGSNSTPLKAPTATASS